MHGCLSSRVPQLTSSTKSTTILEMEISRFIVAWDSFVLRREVVLGIKERANGNTEKEEKVENGRLKTR
jgi:hypothetical protein